MTYTYIYMYILHAKIISEKEYCFISKAMTVIVIIANYWVNGRNP